MIHLLLSEDGHTCSVELNKVPSHDVNGFTHVAACPWFHARGGVPLVSRTWWRALGFTHVAACPWFHARGGVPLVSRTWRRALGFTHVAACPWFHARGVPLVNSFTWCEQFHMMWTGECIISLFCYDMLANFLWKYLLRNSNIPKVNCLKIENRGEFKEIKKYIIQHTPR